MVGILCANNTVHENAGDHFAMVGILCVNDIGHENSGDDFVMVGILCVNNVFMNTKVIIFAISWFPINLINLLADCIELGGAFTFSKSS